jgi:diguanylate cyclase (GGDEF)-like protein
MSELSQLERIRKQRAYGKRFPPTLEADFRDTQRRRHRLGRVVTFVIQALCIGGAPWYGSALFAPQDGLRPWLILGDSAVALLLITTAVATYRRHDTRLTQVYQATSVIAVAWGALLLRYLSFHGLLAWPPEIISVLIVSTGVFGGFRWIRMAIGTMFCFGLASAMELHFNGVTQASALTVFSLSFMGLIAMLAVYVHELLSRVAWVNHRYADVLARTDPLTGLSTRAEFNRVFNSRLAQARRDRRRVAVLLLDIDHFKIVNDTYGHLFGDVVLHDVGRLIREQYARRPLDLRVRFGGEEVAILWYDVDERLLRVLAERLLAAIRALPLVDPVSGNAVPITASIGLTWLQPRDEVTPVAVLKKADELLYQAKRKGRDRVVLHGYYEGDDAEQTHSDEAHASELSAFGHA